MPADIYLPNWERGQPAALDVTVISPLQQLTLARASSEAGYALQVAEERKKATHAEACRSSGVIFHPLAMETLGGWSQEMLDTVNRISRLQAQRLNRSRGRLPPPPSPTPFRHTLARKRLDVDKPPACRPSPRGRQCVGVPSFFLTNLSAIVL